LSTIETLFLFRCSCFSTYEKSENEEQQRKTSTE
jgi:hypothetical protein